jgi:hypothetical protein
MNATSNSFVWLASINVNEHVEKKNGLSYLSWAWAVDTLLRADPTATWSYRDFNGAPYLTLPDGTAMVFCTVTAFAQARTMQLPVMDHRNRPIPNPDVYQVNTAMQRASEGRSSTRRSRSSTGSIWRATEECPVRRRA